jgi:hypothetical protein
MTQFEVFKANSRDRVMDVVRRSSLSDNSR